jgi:hypothetical protein
MTPAERAGPGLNAIGAYGFLAKAHIGHAVDGGVAVVGRAAEIEARMSVQPGLVADLDRRMAQIDNVVTAATQRGKANGLAAKRVEQGKVFAELEVEKAGTEGERPKPGALSDRRCSASAIRTCCGVSSRWWHCCSIPRRCCCYPVVGPPIRENEARF